MERDYARWHPEKEKLSGKEARVFFREREVWWCSLGANVGSEEDGKGALFARPVVIFRKFNKEIFWAIPLTTKLKTGKFYVPIFMERGLQLQRTAIVSQLRLMDARRLYQRIAVGIDEKSFDNLIEAVVRLSRGS